MVESYWPASLSNSIKFICFIVVENYLDFTAEMFQIDPKGEVLARTHDRDLGNTETNYNVKIPSKAGKKKQWKR